MEHKTDDLRYEVRTEFSLRTLPVHRDMVQRHICIDVSLITVVKGVAGTSVVNNGKVLTQ